MEIELTAYDIGDFGGFMQIAKQIEEIKDVHFRNGKMQFDTRRK